MRIDGNFDVTVEKLLHKQFPLQDKFRLIHQLDYGRSLAAVLRYQASLATINLWCGLTTSDVWSNGIGAHPSVRGWRSSAGSCVDIA